MITAGLIALTLAAPSSGLEFGYTVAPAAPGRPRVIVAPRDSDLAALAVVFDVGSADDGSLPGLTRLSQRAVLESSARTSYEDLVVRLFRADATLAMETGLREARFTLTAPREDFERLAGSLLATLLAPRLDPDKFHAAVERTRNDQREPSRPDGMFLLLTSFVGNDPRYAGDPFGDPGVIEMISFQRVRAHVARWLTPGNATVVFAGGVEPALPSRLLRLYHGGTRHPPERLRIDGPITSSIGWSSEVHLMGFQYRIGE
jgi:predicted Zn-dependent peptidase